MTHKTGRLGRRFARAGMTDPRGQWGTGVPASAGFMPERTPTLQGDGYVFAAPRPACACGLDAYGHCKLCDLKERDLGPSSGNFSKPGASLSREGAQRTRGAPRRGKRKRRR